MPDTIKAAQTDALAKLAEIPAAESEERKAWLEMAYPHLWGAGTEDWFISNDAILALMSEARKQGQRDFLALTQAPQIAEEASRD